MDNAGNDNAKNGGSQKKNANRQESVFSVPGIRQTPETSTI